MPKLNGASENILYLIALAAGEFVGLTAFSLTPSYRNLRKDKTVPPFSEFTARKKKEKATIVAC